jgi:hypothetical protein
MFRRTYWCRAETWNLSSERNRRGSRLASILAFTGLQTGRGFQNVASPQAYIEMRVWARRMNTYTASGESGKLHIALKRVSRSRPLIGGARPNDRSRQTGRTPYGYCQGYAAEAENTSIVSLDNRSRQEINQQIERNSIRRCRKGPKNRKKRSRSATEKWSTPCCGTRRAHAHMSASGMSVLSGSTVCVARCSQDHSAGMVRIEELTSLANPFAPEPGAGFA